MSRAVPIRVAMVHGPGSPQRDGVSDYVRHLISGLDSAAIDAVSVPVRPEGGTGASAAAWARAVQQTGQKLETMQPDIVHVQFAPSAFRFSPVPGARLPSVVPNAVPLVTTVHEYGWWGAPEWVPGGVWRAVERPALWDRETGRLVPSSAAVLCTNAAHARLVARRTGRRPTVVPLAPNVDRVETDVSRDEVRSRFGIAPESVVLAFFGFVHPVKGLRYVIEAIPELAARGIDVHLLVVGAFTSQALPEPEAMAFADELQALCREHQVEDRVTFTGRLSDQEVSAALSGADLGVLPFTEGVTTKSGSLLTLLRHGLPTAITEPDQPDPRLRSGENVAVLAERRSARAVLNTVRDLVEDRRLRERVRAGGVALGEEHAWPEVVEAHRRVYERLLEGQRG